MRNFFDIKIIFTIVFLILQILITACGNLKTQSLAFQLGSPLLPNSTNGSSAFSSFAALQIPISITSSQGFSYIGTLQNGTNSVSLPTSTSLHLTIGYLAEGLTGGQTLAQRCAGSNNGPDTVLYTEYTTDLSIDETTSSVNINFPNPFTVVPFDNFGFKILTPSGTQAANAVVYYEDVISKSAIIDPCKKTAVFDTADAQGRFPTNIPIYSSSGQFRFKIVSSDGTTQIITAVLPKSSSTAQFYFMRMGGAGSITPMNINTDSFLDDGNSIVYRRDVLVKNPRYNDITYTFQAPDPISGFTSLYPNNQGNQTNNRQLIAKCQITYANAGSHGTIVYPFQTCNFNINNIFTDLTTLTNGTTYFLDAYLMDSENFVASSATQAAPYTPYIVTTPYPYSFLTPGPPP